MQTHNLTQGSAAWLAYRREHFNASDAPSMMGASPYKTRGALLRELHTGVAPEVSDQAAFLFARGHKFEAAARTMAEALLGEDLFPVVASRGRLSASFDGLTMDEATAWEHKMLNDELRECFRQMETIAPQYRELEAGRELPAHHRIQMEQQLHVSGAERVLFTASTWADNGALLEAAHCWYYPDAQLRAEILNGWAQFERDLAAYVLPVDAPAAPAGRAPSTLPALRIEVAGQVTASNLAEFKSTALAAIRGVRRELSTDQDFADAEASVKWCTEVESRLDAAKQHALSQIASIDELFRTIDDISAEARRVRLELDKLVKARKDAIRAEIATAARQALQAHAARLAPECAPAVLNLAGLGDFAAAIKGKRTITSLRDACDLELARARIALDDQARAIRANLGAYRELLLELDYGFLFPDLGALATKAADDFGAAVRQRIRDHEAHAARRAEQQRERIRAEEQAKAQREADERARDEAARVAKIRDGLEGIREGASDARMVKTAADVQQEIDFQIRVKTPTRERFQEFFDEAVALFDSTLATMREIHERRLSEEAAAATQSDGEARARVIAAASATPITAPAPAPPLAAAPAAAPAPAPAADEPATLKLGTICDRLGFVVNAAFVADTLGVAPASIDRSAKLYRESDFQSICVALVDHVAGAARAAARDWRVAPQLAAA